MAGFRDYSVSAVAIEQAVALGLRTNTAHRVAIMAKRSAPLTHSAGNRRFDDYVLRIEDGVVTAISKY